MVLIRKCFLSDLLDEILLTAYLLLASRGLAERVAAQERYVH